MRRLATGLLLLCLPLRVPAQDSTRGPTDKKAQKTYQQGLEYLQKRDSGLALWYFKKADQQDGGHCLPCQQQMVQLGLQQRDWKAAEDGASELATQMQEPKYQAIARHSLGTALMNEGLEKHQNELIARARGIL